MNHEAQQKKSYSVWLLKTFSKIKAADLKALRWIKRISRKDSLRSDDMALSWQSFGVLLYGLEVCPLTKAELHSLDFADTRFLINLFKTSSIPVLLL